MNNDWKPEKNISSPWDAEMDNKQEKWLVYTKLWTRDPQQPYDP